MGHSSTMNLVTNSEKAQRWLHAEGAPERPPSPRDTILGYVQYAKTRRKDERASGASRIVICLNVVTSCTHLHGLVLHLFNNPVIMMI